MLLHGYKVRTLFFTAIPAATEEGKLWTGQGRAPATTLYPSSEAPGGPGSATEPNARSWAGGDGSAIAETSDGSGRARANTITRRNYDARQGGMEVDDDEEGAGSSAGDDDIEMG